MDNSTLGTHGADTSNYGQRHFEFYNNTGVFNGYNDGTTFNLANGWVGLISRRYRADLQQYSPGHHIHGLRNQTRY